MESENVRLVRETYEAWNRGDLEAILAGSTADFEFRLNVNLPGVPEVIRGHEGIRELFREWFTEPWEGRLEMRVEELREVEGGRVLALIHFHGRGRGSGVEVEGEYAHLGTVRDGRIADIEGFPSWEEARRAAGLGA